jgi:hypothetical protein
LHIKQLAQTDMASHTTDTGMLHKRNATPDSGQPMVYQIRITGHLGREWTDWFEGLAITLEDNGDTLLTGPVVDQAALHGLLKKVRDLGMPLRSVIPLEEGEHVELPSHDPALAERLAGRCAAQMGSAR